MNIKEVMCKILLEKKKSMKLSYEDLMEMSGLSRSQLSYIFCHDGQGVSLDNLEMLGDVLGIEFAVEEVFKVDDQGCNS